MLRRYAYLQIIIHDWNLGRQRRTEKLAADIADVEKCVAPPEPWEMAFRNRDAFRQA